MDTPIDLDICKSVLDRVVASTPLKRSARLRDLLTYVGRRALEDGCSLIREQEIGIEVFGRPEGYDTTADNIVRVNATELRKRIDTYFETEGAHESVVMEIPRGGYVPVFRYRAVSLPEPDELAPQTSLPDSVEPPAEPDHVIAEPAPRHRRPALIVLLILGAFVIVGLGVECVSLWVQNRSLADRISPWRNKPAEAALWTQFTSGTSDTDLVVGDSALGLVEDLERQQVSLQDFLSRAYLAELETQGPKAKDDAILRMLARRTLVSRGSFTMAQKIEALQSQVHPIHAYFARNYNPGSLSRDNVILFGGRLSNPWMELFENHMNFVIKHDFNAEDNPSVAHASVINRAPKAGEQAMYTPAPASGFCTIAYLPNPGHLRNALIIAGTTSEAAEGCGQFLLSEDTLAAFADKLHVTGKFPYFEALLRTSHVAETPLAATLVAYRAYPNLH